MSLGFQKIDLTPSNETFARLMSNGSSYQIPAFQRSYSWKEEYVEDLWQDITHMRENRQQHFMSYIVLQHDKDNNKEHYQIVDGQQRITTIVLLIIAALKRFTDLNDAQSIERKELYHQTYLGIKDPFTLQTSLKLTLNQNNHGHFKEVIEHYDIPKIRGVKDSNRTLNNSLTFFNRQLESCSSEEVVKLIEDVAQGLIFTVIKVGNENSAYTVFETLNSRGMHLAVPDLLKNYLLSKLTADIEDATKTKELIEMFDEQWNNILEQLGEKTFTHFLRNYEGIYRKLTQKNTLFREIKKHVQSDNQVMPYVSDLKKYAPIFTALQNPTDTFWKDYDERYLACKEDLKVLKTFGIKTPLTLLMVAYDKLKPQEFNNLVKWIAVISVRYNVICNKLANQQEPIYNKIANQLSTPNSKPTIGSIKKSLLAIYVEDAEFISAFSSKTMANNKHSAYLLQAIEIKINKSGQCSEKLTIEHILPNSPNEDWQKYFGRETWEDAKGRLGNLALISGELGQQPFEKKKAYLSSNEPCAITQAITQYSQWNIDSLEQHQKWLAKEAKAVWRID